MHNRGEFDNERVLFFAPPPAYQIVNNRNTDTPVPPEEPIGKNPPDGATIDFWLPKAATLVTLDVIDSAGMMVRRFASNDPEKPVDPLAITVMPEWARPPSVIGTKAGAHRFVWDLRGPKVAGGRGLPMTAIWFDTPAGQGAWVPVGTYTLRLSVDGREYVQPLEVRADPRL